MDGKWAGDGSPQTTFPVRQFSRLIDTDRLRWHSISVFDNKIAIATETNLIISEGTQGLDHWSDEAVILTGIQFDAAAGKATTLTWLNSEIVAVGFDSGTFACFHINGSVVIEVHCHDSSIQAFQISSREVQELGQPNVWILHESGILVVIPVKDIIRRDVQGYLKLRLIDSALLNDFVFLPFGLSLFTSEISNLESTTHMILVGGMNHALSAYCIGGKLKFQHLGKLAGYVKDQVENVITKTFFSFFSSPAVSPNMSANGQAPEVEEKALTSQLDFKDPKRRILRLSIESQGKLIAAADSLGRVTLYDTRLNAIIRMWKGLRDARLGWSEEYSAQYASNSGSVTKGKDRSKERDISANMSANISPCSSSRHRARLVLAIYAPQIGLLYMYAMSHGPLLRTIPVGMNAHLASFPFITDSGERLMKCYLLKPRETSQSENSSVSSSVAVKVEPLATDEQDDKISHSADTIKMFANNSKDIVLELQMVSPFSISVADIDTSIQPADLAPLSHPNESEVKDISTETSTSSAASSEELLKQKLLQIGSNEQVALLNIQSVLVDIVRLFLVWCIEVEGSSQTHSTPRVSSSRQVTPRPLSNKSMPYLTSSDAETWIKALMEVLRTPASLVTCMGMIEIVETLGWIQPSLNSSSRSHNGSIMDSFNQAIQSVVREVFSGTHHTMRGSIGSRLAPPAVNCSDFQPYLRRFIYATSAINSREIFNSEHLVSQHVTDSTSDNACKASPSTARNISQSSSTDKVPNSIPGSSHVCVATRARNTNPFERPIESSKASIPVAMRFIHFSEELHQYIIGKMFACEEALLVTEARSRNLILQTYTRLISLMNKHSSVATLKGGIFSRSTFLLPLPAYNKTNGAIAGSSLYDYSVDFGDLDTQSALEDVDEIETAEIGKNTNRAESLSWLKLQRSFMDKYNIVMMRKAAKAALVQTRRSSVLEGAHSSKSDIDGVMSERSGDNLSVLSHEGSTLLPQSTGVFSGHGSTASTPLGRTRSNSFLKSPSSAASDGSAHGGSRHSVLFGSNGMSQAISLNPTLKRLYLQHDSTIDQFLPLFGQSDRCISFSTFLKFAIFKHHVDKYTGSSTAVEYYKSDVHINPIASQQHGEIRIRVWELAYLFHLSSDTSNTVITLEAPYQESQQTMPSMPFLSIGNAIISRGVAEITLSFIYSPLISDILSLPTYLTAIEPFALDSVMNLADLLTAVITLLEAVPVQRVSILVMKKPIQSPFQKLFRDILLRFYEHYIIFASKDGSSDADASTDTDTDTELTNLQNFVIHSTSRNASFDEIINKILEPAVSFLRQSANVECGMAICALVVEVFTTVSEPIERRSYGKANLTETLKTWTRLMRQFRVLLFLSARRATQTGGSLIPSSALTIGAVDSGAVSIYSILAADTLCFATDAEAANDHEQRCLDVFMQKIQSLKTLPSTNSPSIISTKRLDGVPPASSPAPTSGSGSGRRPPKPPLTAWNDSPDGRWKELFRIVEADIESLEVRFEGVNSTTVNTASSSITSRDESTAPPTNEDSVQSQDGKDKTKQQMLRKRPLLLFFPYHNDSVTLGTYRVLILIQRWISRPQNMDHYSLAVAHLGCLPGFERAALAHHVYIMCLYPLVDLLLELEESHARRCDVEQSLNEILTVLSTTENVVTFTRRTSELLSFVAMAAEVGNCTDPPTTAAPQWPPTSDPFVEGIQGYYNSVHPVDQSSMMQHLVKLWLLQLRFTCGLRGVKPSQLLGDLNSEYTLDTTRLTVTLLIRGLLDPIEVTRQLYDEPLVNLNKIRKYEILAPLEIGSDRGQTALEATRKEFLLQCFRRLPAEGFSLVYKCGSVLQVAGDEYRLIHLSSLLERCTSDADHIADEIVSQVKRVDIVVDCLLRCLRQRLGACIAHIEKVPRFATEMASIDVAASQWARSAVGQPDVALVMQIMAGDAPPVNFDLLSTRHLVMRTHGLLLNVSSSKSTNIGTSKDDPRWHDRIEKTNWLLALCTSLRPLTP